jgi:ADP-ribose pyrophosphatase YjhB (NUDIX family)
MRNSKTDLSARSHGLGKLPAMSSEHSNSKQEIIVRAILVRDGALLVNKSTNKLTNEEYFALPGGHVDAGESCTLALHREIYEELQAEIDVLDLCFVSESIYAGRKKDDIARHELVLYYHCELSSDLKERDGKIESPEGCKNFQWLPHEQLIEANLLPDSVKQFLLATMSDQEYPHYVFHDSTRPKS